MNYSSPIVNTYSFSVSVIRKTSHNLILAGPIDPIITTVTIQSLRGGTHVYDGRGYLIFESVNRTLIGKVYSWR